MEEHFAALRIPDARHDNKLTRAVSFSELTPTRRIRVEECYLSGHSPGLVRQYSCEQIFDTTSNSSHVKICEVVKDGSNERKETWHSVVPHNNAFKIPEWPPRKNKNIIRPPKLVPNKVEYMEVEDADSPNCTLSRSVSPKLNSSRENPQTLVSESGENTKSISQEKKQDNSAKVEEKTDYEGLKKKLRPLVPLPTTQAGKKKSMCSCTGLLFFLLLPIALVMIAIVTNPHHFEQFDKCDEASVFCNVIRELQERVYGQSEAIHTLATYLKQDKPRIKIVCLIGGTGVGKSYTADIINESLFRTKVVNYFPPLENEISTRVLSILFHNLVIVENLREYDLTDAIRFLKPLQGRNDYNVTAILIFNVEHADDPLARKMSLRESLESFREAFQKENINVAVVGFKPLTEETIERCIADAAKLSNLTLTEDQIIRVKHNLLQANTGCKGAYSKVQIFGRQ